MEFQVQLLDALRPLVALAAGFGMKHLVRMIPNSLIPVILTVGIPIVTKAVDFLTGMDISNIYMDAGASLMAVALHSMGKHLRQLSAV